ncbi:MAG: hypothetical protein AAGF94_15710 [Pseudomonadota bacterium]
MFLHTFTRRGLPPRRLRDAFTHGRWTRSALATPKKAGIFVLLAALTAFPAKAMTTINIDAAFQEMVLIGIPNPFSAVPQRAEISVVYDQTSPITYVLAEGSPYDGGGRVYENALQSFTIELFDGSGSSMGLGSGSGGSLTIFDDIFSILDWFTFRDLELTGFAPLTRVSLHFEAPAATVDFVNLPLFTPNVLESFPTVVATIEGFPESDLARFTFVPRDGIDVSRPTAPVPVPATVVYLLSALGALGFGSKLRRGRRVE